MKIISFFLVIILLFSCEKVENQKENNTYQVVSLLYQQFAKPIELVFPPPPPDSLNYVFSSKDSVRIDSIHKNIEKVRGNTKFVVAIYPYFFSYNPLNIEPIDNCSNFNTILKNLIETKDSLKIDIHKILAKNNDSIIFYSKELSKDRRKDFYNFDMQISFSNLSFNSDYTKSVVVGTFRHSRLSGESVLFFLEKIGNKWMIKCQETLSIS